MLESLQGILQNEHFVLFLAIFVPILLTVGAFAIFYFGFHKKKPDEIAAPLKIEAVPQAKPEIESQAKPEIKSEAKPEIKSEAKPEKKLATLSDSLVQTRTGFLGRIKNVFSNRAQLSADELDDLEEILYTSDLGPQTVQKLMQAVQEKLKAEGASGFESVRSAIKDEMLSIFSETKSLSLFNLQTSDKKPFVIMVVGVNGAGKTTSIGKISAQFANGGKKVLVAAGDTFRAAAGSQLKVWTDRAAVEIFSPEGVTDPSAVAFDAVSMGKAQDFDIVIIDTAGRLHTQKSLMEELKKMKRVITKVIPDAPHEVLLVLDASSGQNALQQAREFHAALGITGVVLTKLDGTAKGGVAVGLAYEMKLPIKLIGIGEGIGDLRSFQPGEFVDSII